MARFCGEVGYADTVETKPGVWTDQIVTRKYYGDILKDFRSLDGSDKVNDDISISNAISIVADPYAMKHFHKMKYVEFYGTKWKVRSVEVKYPRLELSIGGLYNGKK